MRDFLNYGEYGLALDTIIDIHAEEGKLLNVEVLDLIKKTSLLMEIDVGTLIDRIG